MTDLQTIASQLHSLATSIETHAGGGDAGSSGGAASYMPVPIVPYASVSPLTNGKKNYDFGPWDEDWSIPFGAVYGSPFAY